MIVRDHAVHVSGRRFDRIKLAFDVNEQRLCRYVIVTTAAFPLLFVEEGIKDGARRLYGVSNATHHRLVSHGARSPGELIRVLVQHALVPGQHGVFG